MKPTKVVVHFSNTPFFPVPEYEYEYEDFKRIAHSCAIQNRANNGKTDITLYFDNGSAIGMELLLNTEGVPSIAVELAQIRKTLASQPIEADTLEEQAKVSFMDFLASVEL